MWGASDIFFGTHGEPYEEGLRWCVLVQELEAFEASKNIPNEMLLTRSCG